MLSIAQPADRLLEGQTRRADPHRAVLELIEAGGEAAQGNSIVAPLPAALHIPARLHRGKMSLAPVAPLPAAAVGQKIARLTVQMQRKVAHLLLMGAEDRLQAAIDALKHQKIGALGLDVYENERDLFFEDKSNDVIQDDVFRRLSACHNVLFTGHQAFLTAEALISISETTLGNLQQLEKGEACPNELA